MPVNAAVYCPTRGFVFCETTKALEPYNPSYVREKAAIAPARNWIARDFLAGDADVLVMCDDDTVPPPGFVENLAVTPYDICAAVVPMVTRGKPFFPNAFHLRDGQYVSANDLIKHGDAREVDAVGTGCILIRRHVLEDKRLTRPFEPEMDRDGVIVTGEDFNFCKRARAFGYTVAAHFGVWCEHFTAVHANGVSQAYIDLLDMALMQTEIQEGIASA